MKIWRLTNLISPIRRLRFSSFLGWSSFRAFCTDEKPKYKLEEYNEEEQKEMQKDKFKVTLETESLPDDLPEDKNLNGWVNKLNDRIVIGVRGEDATKFLQSIMTVDMQKMEDNKNQRALYGLFLNPKGRIIADAFIYCKI